MKKRNFVILSHVDHGKTTLAETLLKITKSKEAVLDSHFLEKEKKVTIKLHPVSFFYKDTLLNLIDTPGHPDFLYETSRSLFAVEGAVLLIDAKKGPQAQTYFLFEEAKKENLKIIPCLSKIDLVEKEKIKALKKEISKEFGFREDEILPLSAKEDINLDLLLERIVEDIPSPRSLDEDFLGLVFDSRFDPYLGCVIYLRVFGGEIKKGDKIYLFHQKVQSEVKEVGIFRPYFEKKEKLSLGDIGYIKTTIKDPQKVKIGETVFKIPFKDKKALPGFKEIKPVVFASVFPYKETSFDDLKESILKLRLEDPSFSFKEISKKPFGKGYFMGFLGMFHLEIILERLKREFNLNLLLSPPSVSFKIKEKSGKVYEISSPDEFREPQKIEKIYERMVEVDLFFPVKYSQRVFSILPSFEAEVRDVKVFKERMKVQLIMPFRKLVENFYEKIKSVSQGFGSFFWRFSFWKETEITLLEILVEGKKEESLKFFVKKDEAQKKGKTLLKKLKENFPPYLFSVKLQAVVGGKVVAREDTKAMRKDVLAPLYGGDVTRKMKLLERQKRGKKRLKEKTKVILPPEVILKILKEE